jgi:diguanylate cyclase (GGDEF)-like protein
MSENTGDKQRLLIVDDSKVVRVTARKILRDHFETVEAVDGENAWEILSSEEPFSLIVSDLTMPKLDGFGLIERIRSSHQPQLCDIPVVVITGSNDSEAVKQRATEAGATDFIGKPFDAVDLLARTQAHASAHAATQALTKEKIALEEQSLLDPLTGLPNETAFMKRALEQLSYATRHNTRLAVFRIEIDNFGELFRRHGQEISEAMIKTAVTVLQSAIRHEDMVARTGAARFTLLLPGMAAAGVRLLAERINGDISKRSLKQDATRINMTVSIGVAAPDIHRRTRLDDLLVMADAHLAHGLAQGGNRVVFEDTASDLLAPKDQKAVPEPVLASQEAAVTGTGRQPDEEVIQIDGIDTGTPDMAVTGANTGDSDMTTIVNRSAATPEPLPGSFAGPVPDMAAAATRSKSAAASEGSTGGPVVSRAIPGKTRADFTFDNDFEESETIVITALEDLYAAEFSEPEQETGTDSQPDTPAFGPADRASEPAPTTATEAPPAATRNLARERDEIETTPARRGLLRRMLSGIGSLFRRRPRQHF